MAAYPALGEALLEEGRNREACSALEKGFTRGEAALPVDFKGEIRWVCHRNRPFLRTAHVLTLCYRNAGERKKAIKTMEKMLGWNPSDNQGIRWLIGSEYMRAGQRSRAESTFREHGSEYPPYRYELGLLYFQEGEHARAATSLRHGFIENPYIAEILCGTPAPMRLTILGGQQPSGRRVCASLRRIVRRVVARDRARVAIPQMGAHAPEGDDGKSRDTRLQGSAAVELRHRRARTHSAGRRGSAQSNRRPTIDHDRPGTDELPRTNNSAVASNGVVALLNLTLASDRTCGYPSVHIINEQELLGAGDQLVASLAQHAQATPRGGRPHPTRTAAPRTTPPVGGELVRTRG